MSAAVGRPRDAEIDREIIEAAVIVYARAGWGRFTFDAVASQAGVGKPAIYLRYGDKAELLIAAMIASQDALPEIDTGDLRTDLVSYVNAAFRFRLSALGAAIQRMFVEQQYHSELHEPFRSRIVRPQVQLARQIVERAKERGELPTTLSTDIFLEALDGAVMNRVNDTWLANRELLAPIIDDYASELVDLLLAGARAAEG